MAPARVAHEARGADLGAERSRDKGELGAMTFDPFVATLEAESKPPR